MILLEKVGKEVKKLKASIAELEVSLDLANVRYRVEEIEMDMTAPDFWNDNEAAQIKLKFQKMLKNKIEKYDQLFGKAEELEGLIEMALEDNDDSMEEEIDESYRELEVAYEKLLLETLLKGDYDANNAIFSIHAGSGGTDAQDWASMLLRMYKRWGEQHGYGVKVLDLQNDTEAGIKSVSLLFEGLNAYGFLKSEKGVHRIVRISPFDASGKRHTSFSSVDVMPELDDSVEIDINPVDLKIDTYRSSGSGGQHVNTTDSAVRITHIPTGVVVQCQNERSQIANRATAMKMLMGKLIELQEREHKDKIEDLAGDYSQITWGSQIRSYVFHPYNLVKDHRTGAEMGNIQAVMDGDIDIFIDAYLKEANNHELKTDNA
ncbi:peptide chain release factor 2 [Fusibacter bizertensis]|uniref:Peptide chain release factor 2 n=1 Tax=Fusibacter bizertensis TaxID=1488331 RepID=A0ABT6NDW5_9FIRM|nr:peptide chain release factor 2 [Fusibacter bizertensis]MDH8678615.1 peptide chain release factor 2 [Fusibacter bizertensis]